ncbi:outer membrane protein assembly factor BamA [Pedobacter sp. UYP24]
MKKMLFLLVFVICSISLKAQMKLIRKLLSNQGDSARGASFMPLPVFGYSQESGFQFGMGALYSFYADKTDTLNRSSNFSANLSYSTKKTYSLSLYGDAWSKGNRYHAMVESRFRKLPFSFYGIGNRTRQADETRLEEQAIQLLFDLERSFIKDTYTGVSLGFEHYAFDHHWNNSASGFSPSIQGNRGGKVVFLGVSQSYDTRNSNNYPTKGFFGRATYQYAPIFFGRESFTGSKVTLNLRNFTSLGRKLVWGTQGIFQTVVGSHLPFYILPQLGSDEMMRGYYTGRFRDQHLITMQSELRYRYSKRLGSVIFLGTGTVWGKRDLAWNRLKPDLGAGLRYFYDPAKGLSMRFDYGIGEKRLHEARQKGFYVSIAEAF